MRSHRIKELALYFLRLGLLGFGGPVAFWGVWAGGWSFGAYAAAIGTILGASILLGRIAIGLIAFPLLQPLWVMVR